MIYIEVLHLNWKPGSELMIGASRRDRKLFEDYVAKHYVQLVKLAVLDQRFKAKWIPLSRRYLRYKQSHGLSLRTWEATGDLISHLKRKRGGNIGFDNRLRHKTSKEKYIVMARRLEYGNLTIPARPLFRFVYWYMKKNIKFFYNRWKAGKP